MLKDILGRFKGKNRPVLPGGTLRRLNEGANGNVGGQRSGEEKAPPSRAFKRLGVAVRFVVRMQIAARGWAEHEKVRQRLAEAAGEMQRQARLKKMRDEWKAQGRVASMA